MDALEEAREGRDPRVFCFESDREVAAFDRSVTELMAAMQNETHSMFVSEHNVLRLNHGGKWTHSARDDDPETTMHVITAEMSIPFKDIADNDLNLIARTLQPISEEMQRQFSQNMYGVVGAAAEKVGNVVNAQETGSFAESMLEMFRKIELGVDRDGNISMPQLHVSPETYKKIAAEMNSTPPDVQAEIEKVKAAKIEEAFEREAERKAKFRAAES